MHLLVTRPEADARLMTLRLEATGHTVTVEPLVEMQALAHGWPVLNDVQALIVTSRNALRALAGKPGIETARRYTLIAVGAGTAAAARAAGFSRILAGPAGAAELVPLIQASLEPAAGRLLHLAGEEVAFDLAGTLAGLGYVFETMVCYRMVARTALSADTAQKLADGVVDGVVLMSPRTAEIYAGLIAGHGLRDAVGNVVHLCLSAAVAGRLAALGNVVKAIPIQPNLEEMLALADRVAAQLPVKS